MSQQPRYQIYPSLMDKYTNYLRSADIYDKYWGGSENPPFTYEEFEAQQFADLIDGINRVPKDLPQADIGTAFNEIVDCMVLGVKSDKMPIERVYLPSADGSTNEVGCLKAELNGRFFVFPIEMCREFADYYKACNAIPQKFVEGLIDTPRGLVRLYGYVDELTDHGVHDIKTSGSYEAFKFKGNAQHLVYPYCLNAMGIEVREFSYDLAHIDSGIKRGAPVPDYIEVKYLGSHQEEYSYIADRDEPILRERLCALIDFLEAHRDLITDTKIFGG